jgi:carbon storage regulator CsrA
MLVLTRKDQESVVVGGSAGFEQLLKVTVLEISPGKVKLGFEADKGVPVHRWEIWQKMQAGAIPNGRAESPEVPVAAGAATHPLRQTMGHRRPEKLPNVAGEVHRKRGILVVDDEPSVRSVLNAAMQEQGFTVWLAADGQEALDLYQRHRAAIDVVLLDVRMPVLDGPCALAELRRMNREIRCCFMTGDLGRHAETTLSSLGAAAVIRKPFRPVEVARMLWELAAAADGSPASL